MPADAVRHQLLHPLHLKKGPTEPKKHVSSEWRRLLATARERSAFTSAVAARAEACGAQQLQGISAVHPLGQIVQGQANDHRLEDFGRPMVEDGWFSKPLTVGHLFEDMDSC